MNTNDGGTGSKMTWDDWSDLEVNKAVYEALGLTPDDLDILVESMSNQLVEAMPFMPKAYEGVCIYYGKDYCNNPADMWPVIIENNISLINDGAGNIGAAHDDFKQVWLPKYRALRAAAIVFLEINGVKPND